MATADLQNFMETRLAVLTPGIDLSPGSPAQTLVIGPLLQKLGTDPMTTDIDAFITDRFAQEFPDIYAEDPSVVRDLFIKPLILLLEPFKREVNIIKVNSSFQNPDLLSEAEAAALAANLFITRETGSYATGTVRCFFQNPRTVQVDVTTRFFTSSGLSFFPVTSLGITAESMTFNISGSQFYFDIPVKAEKQGSEYNLAISSITGSDGVLDAVSVTNLVAFTNGQSQVDVSTFARNAGNSLSERSLTVGRGIAARILSRFQNQVRAVQAIGAGDPEMQRDVLTALHPGNNWITGQVFFYTTTNADDRYSLAFVRARTVEGSVQDVPNVGDFVYVFRGLAVAEGARTLKFPITQVIDVSGPSGPYVAGYLLLIDSSAAEDFTTAGVYEGGCSRRGTVVVSMDDGEHTYRDGELHIGGRTDAFIRPVTQDGSTVTIARVMDMAIAESGRIEGSKLVTCGVDGVLAHNYVYDSSKNYILSGVKPGHYIVILQGSDVGAYRIGAVGGTFLHLEKNLTASESELRYVILPFATMNLFEPRIERLPFADSTAGDLSTVIGSKNFSLGGTNLLDFGTVLGDTLEVVSGDAAGVYKILAFDPLSGGRGVVVDAAAPATTTNSKYKVYSKLTGAERPLVRIKSIDLLDSSQQPSGVSVPPAESVGSIALSKFVGARKLGSSARNSGFVLPALGNLYEGVATDYLVTTNVPAATGDRRFSLGFDEAFGVYKSMEFQDGGQAELDFKNSSDTVPRWFVATAEVVNNPVNNPPVQFQAGHVLHLKTGANAGDYLIQQVYNFQYTDALSKKINISFVKIYDRFKTDPLREVFDFLYEAEVAGAGGVAIPHLDNVSGTTQFPSYFTDIYDSIGTRLAQALAFYGSISPQADDLQTIFESVASSEYEVGTPANGVVRSFYTEPVEVELGIEESERLSIFRDIKDSRQSFRPAISTPPLQILPLREGSDVTSPLDYPRGITVSGTTITVSEDDTATLFNLGVKKGDVLTIHPEILLYSVPQQQGVVRTVKGSAIVESPSNSFFPSLLGNLLFIDDGTDSGGYLITECVDSAHIKLDRPLKVTTPTILASGSLGHWGYQGGQNKLVDASSQFNLAHINKYLTMYGVVGYQGSYKISAVTSATEVVLDRTAPSGLGNFPAYDASGANGVAHWVITDAPPSLSDIKKVGNGTTTYGAKSIRLYLSQSQRSVIDSVTPSPTNSQAELVDAVSEGLRQPFSITRKNVRRVTPSEMQSNRQGGFFFFDQHVISLSSGEAANLAEGSYLLPDEGTVVGNGYRLVTKNKNLSYSMREDVSLLLPNNILPPGLRDDFSNRVRILEGAVRINYERSPEVQQVQEFADTPEEKPLSNDFLVRHFLPAYVSFEAQYAGGSKSSVIYADMQAYVEGLEVQEPLDVSELTDFISQRGGNPVTPTTAYALTHDQNRKRWLTLSQNQLGGILEDVPYEGTTRTAFYRMGRLVSPEDSETTINERVTLDQS